MDSNDLPCEQCEIIRDRLQPYCAYLIKLQRRMEKRGFIPTDELFQAVDRAYDAAHTLWVKLHYMSCPSGVCRGQRPRGNEPGAPFAAWAASINAPVTRCTG
jgi:hypothetical protein